MTGYCKHLFAIVILIIISVIISHYALAAKKVPMDSFTKQSLEDFVSLGSDLFESRMAAKQLTDFNQNPITGTVFDPGDILVLSQKIVSKAEGAVIALNSCRPSEEALKLARTCNKDARLVELILRESKKVLRVGHNLIITEHKRG